MKKILGPLGIEPKPTQSNSGTWPLDQKRPTIPLQIQNFKFWGERRNIPFGTIEFFLFFSTHHKTKPKKPKKKKEDLSPKNYKSNMIAVDIVYGASFGAFIYCSWLIYMWSKLCICEKRPKPEFGPYTRSHYRFEEYYVWCVSPFLVRCWTGLKNPTSAAYP